MFSYQKKGSYTYGSRDSVTSLFLSKLILHLLYFCNSFLIMFILFHSAVYDDIIGCQNLSAINTPIAKAVEKDEDYKEVALYHKVEQAALDLRVKKNINDEKIISQYEYCKNAGFEYVQGYLFSKPIPYDMITNYFQKNKLLLLVSESCDYKTNKKIDKCSHCSTSCIAEPVKNACFPSRRKALMKFIYDAIKRNYNNRKPPFFCSFYVACKCHPECKTAKTDKMNKLICIPETRHLFDCFLTGKIPAAAQNKKRRNPFYDFYHFTFTRRSRHFHF